MNMAHKKLTSITGMHGIHLITIDRVGIACVESEQVVQLRSPGLVRPRQLLQILAESDKDITQSNRQH